MKSWVNDFRADKGSQTYNLHWLAGSTLLSEEHKQNLYLFEMLPPEILRQGWLFKQLLCHWQTTSTPRSLVCRIIFKISHQGTVTTSNEGYHREHHFCRNLCFRGVIWPIPLITQSSHLSWFDMHNCGDQTTRTTAGETCSFNSCISLCVHSYDPVRSSGGQEPLLKKMSIISSIKGVVTVCSRMI